MHQYNGQTVATDPLVPFTDADRDAMRRWLDNWRVAGAFIEDERVATLQALTDRQAARAACDLWSLAEAGRGDDAEGLLTLKRILRRLEPRP